jgi:putative transposase
MRGWQSQSHVRWYCRYHVVIVPKYRHKAIFGVLRKDSVGMSGAVPLSRERPF